MEKPVREKIIEEHLRRVGIDEQLNGFQYLVDVIGMQMDRPHDTLRQLHATVAESIGTSPENISVSIHYCLRRDGMSYKEREFVRNAAAVLSSGRRFR